ncbi:MULTISPECIES: SDR family oxidoreductase [unclassified Planococcus (in: firmicutes)]|uniref:SDR family NAD(P)-dependent oxidoreductase n=1 Tax=unclassified Planococcus (in: firmicutes) TaxID=2662419 RepID=UPI000C32E182|nr:MULTISPECIES: SDR family NAD(P)-dependent oxidoreductase [unclassified Planococcus (in: firmicutes)]AUD13000.1 oxidoreductase [Planococcus sp. MB-3u-03]PKG45521.1 oxidoreductase [Planococcus sp. Urea-trap-24]PKG88882.1 oxidoreductase [Planococcus sp. Urea-3u-39]PKH36250.1 oxidoreductase [Planococcus sp. MB-3u-09]
MKYTVITGASSGIGYEAALAFATCGKNLILVARRENELNNLKEKIQSMNSELDVVIKPTDLSDSEQVHALYESLKEYDIETFVNNAGFGNSATVAEQDMTKTEKMLRVNVEALTTLSTLYARDYADQEGAQLINVSSDLGYRLVPNAVTYAATKFYVSAFTEGLAQELQDNGARLKVKILAPSMTETEFVKTARELDEFSYSDNVQKFHTSKEMAQFMLELYDSEQIVGKVNSETYEFELMDPVFQYTSRK